MTNETPSRKYRLLGVVLLLVVAAVVYFNHQYFVPLFLGVMAWSKPLLLGSKTWIKVMSKAWAKSVTPKLGLLLMKNSVVLQLRRVLMKVTGHLFVKSHKPWRRSITRIRLAIIRSFKRLTERYVALPLWLRTVLAIGLLVATAGSSFALIALLIIPQAILEWLRKMLTNALNRLGVTRVLTALWRFFIPERWRYRWYMYIKWKLGREQVKAAKRLHEKIVTRSASA